MQVVIATDPGSPDRPNEDFAAAGLGAAVLLDGATTPADVDTGCIHGVAWYARTLGAALLAGITAVPHVPLQQALAAAAGAERWRWPRTGRPSWSTGTCTRPTSSTVGRPAAWSPSTPGPPGAIRTGTPWTGS